MRPVVQCVADHGTCEVCMAYDPAIWQSGSAYNVGGVLQAWLVPLEVVGPGSGCAWHTGPAVHSGFKASWHAGLKASLTGFIRQTVCPHAELASKMHVKITGMSFSVYLL